MKRNVKLWIKLVSLALGTTMLYGCSKVELKADPVISELGADVFANPRLYLKDGDDIDLEKADVYSAAPGVVQTRNRFVSNGLSYLQTGDYDFVLEYDGRQYPFVLKVKDTTAPTCTLAPEYIDVNPGAIVNWEDVFQARDLSGVYYECSDLDTGTAGSYEAHVKIADRFGNSVIKTIVVNVGISSGS